MTKLHNMGKFVIAQPSSHNRSLKRIFFFLKPPHPVERLKDFFVLDNSPVWMGEVYEREWWHYIQRANHPLINKKSWNNTLKAVIHQVYTVSQRMPIQPAISDTRWGKKSRPRPAQWFFDQILESLLIFLSEMIVAKNQNRAAQHSRNCSAYVATLRTGHSSRMQSCILLVYFLPFRRKYPQ